MPQGSFGAAVVDAGGRLRFLSAAHVVGSLSWAHELGRTDGEFPRDVEATADEDNPFLVHKRGVNQPQLTQGLLVPSPESLSVNAVLADGTVAVRDYVRGYFVYGTAARSPGRVTRGRSAGALAPRPVGNLDNVPPSYATVRLAVPTDTVERALVGGGHVTYVGYRGDSGSARRRGTCGWLVVDALCRSWARGTVRAPVVVAGCW